MYADCYLLATSCQYAESSLTVDEAKEYIRLTRKMGKISEEEYIELLGIINESKAIVQ